jgi:release factor glutamine methyltransferase
MHRMPTVEEVLREAVRALKESDAIEHPHQGKERYDAEELLQFVLGEEPDGGRALSGDDYRRFRRLLSRRASGEPVAYLTGRTEFDGLTLGVGRGAFIPRESSEFMVAQAVRRLRRRNAPVLVDLATGIGPVALAVAARVPSARVFGIDLFARPVARARRNAGALGLGNVRFLRGDLFSPLPSEIRGAVDVFTVHPPYVGRRELRQLPAEIRDFEPAESLTDRSRDGMALLGRVVAGAPEWLRPGGWLLVEVSPDRSRTVAGVMRRGGMADVRSTKGPVPVSRVVVGRRR